MPAASVAAYAASQGRSKKEVERYWAKAKELVKARYGLSEPLRKEDKARKERFYKLTMGIFKRMLGVQESFEEVSGHGVSQLEFKVLSRLQE